MSLQNHITARPNEPDAPVSEPLPVAALVARERLLALHAAVPLPLSIGLLFCLLPVCFLWSPATAAALLTWLTARALCVVLRALDTLDFQRRELPAAELPARYRRFLLLLSVDALSWGAMVWLPHHPSVPGFDGALLASLIGVCAIALLTFSCSRQAYALFSTGCLLPLALHLLSIGSLAGDFSVPGLLFFWGLSLFEARRIEARSLELMRLRFEHARVAEERRQSLEQAERLADSKRQMVATLSHEIRTPLNGILGMTQLISRSKLNAQQASQLALLQRSGRHLLGLVNDMLDLARIEAGKLSIDREPLALREVIDEVCQLLSGRAAEKGLRFERQLSPALPNCVIGDAARIRQVLHNLVGNAIKFTDTGSVRVEVCCESEQLLRFDVHDSGEGIAASELERIFSPFEQGRSEGMRRREGTGLGLAISLELARAMGGDLRCVSTPGQGSVFSFTLPWLPCAALQQDEVLAAPTELPALQGRVLLVEDCPVNALVALSMLERCGLEVIQAEDGEQALAQLAGQPFDLVLMDCQMPGLDGFETTRRWRALEATDSSGRPAVPIIALTANAGSGDRQRCLDAGMNDYLTKPFELEALATLVHRHLGAAATTPAD